MPTAVLSTFLGGLVISFTNLTGFAYDSTDDDLIDEEYTWHSSTLWVLRVFGVLLSALLMLVSYIAMRDYALTTKVSEAINAVIKSTVEEREVSNESGGHCNHHNHYNQHQCLQHHHHIQQLIDSHDDGQYVISGKPVPPFCQR